MHKDQALMLAYIAAEAMNNKETKPTLLHFYGTFGVDNAWQAIKALSICVTMASYPNDKAQSVEPEDAGPQNKTGSPAEI